MKVRGLKIGIEYFVSFIQVASINCLLRTFFLMCTDLTKCRARQKAPLKVPDRCIAHNEISVTSNIRPFEPRLLLLCCAARVEARTLEFLDRSLNNASLGLV